MLSGFQYQLLFEDNKQVPSPILINDKAAQFELAHNLDLVRDREIYDGDEYGYVEVFITWYYSNGNLTSNRSNVKMILLLFFGTLEVRLLKQQMFVLFALYLQKYICILN